MLSRAEVFFIARIDIWIERTNQRPDNWMEMTNEYAGLRGVKCWHKQAGYQQHLDIVCAAPVEWEWVGIATRLILNAVLMMIGFSLILDCHP